jgi:sugar (pentulose or hexulose) kinase
MSGQNVILIFDVGKTNKKVLLFDEQYKLLHEEDVQLAETVDEDGFPCEDLTALTQWIKEKFSEITDRKGFDVKAVNFSAYGASFVHLDKNLRPVTPLYNYLKPLSEDVKSKFYDMYGGEKLIAKETASPVLGLLNSGMQLFRLKYEKVDVYGRIKYSLHLPQYLSFIISHIPSTDISSVGCHTNLWDFKKNKYHDWVYKEELDEKFASLYNGNKIIASVNEEKIKVGIGLHDSSAALIPYLTFFHDPFILISTGTWCISLNPFNHIELTDSELRNDCLCYLSYEGNPVKASRLFAGYEHEQQIKRLAVHYKKPVDHFKNVEYDNELINRIQRIDDRQNSSSEIDLDKFKTYEEAYHSLMWNIIKKQARSTSLVLQGAAVKKIFVDGGFGKNSIYMNLLARMFPNIEIYGATVPQASALGAALAIHKSWNRKPLPNDLVTLKYYPNMGTNHLIK